MGCCCNTRSYPNLNNARPNIAAYIEGCNLDSIKCSDIRQIENKNLDSDQYNKIAQKLQISAPFKLFANKGVINYFDLKAGLLLFSEDSMDEKSKLFNETFNDRRLKMRFFEFKYQLVNERIPTELYQKRLLDYDTYKQFIEAQRLVAADELIKEKTKLSKNEEQLSYSFIKVT